MDSDAACVHVDEYFSQRILGSVTSDSNGKSIIGTCVKLAAENSLCNLNPTGTNPNIGCQSGFSCTSHYGFNSVGSCQPNNAVGSGCLYRTDCDGLAKCIDPSWNFVRTLSGSNSYWPLRSKCIIIDRALNGICEYAFDESSAKNHGCSSGLICSGIDGISLSGLCKYKLNSVCTQDEDCVKGTNCFDSAGQLILSSFTGTKGTCLLDLGSICSSSASCKTGTSCVFQTDHGHIILDSKKKDPSSPYGTIFGKCITLGYHRDPCNYDFDGIPDAFSGCNSNASPPLYCYNGTKLSTSGMCEPIYGNKALPFDINTFVDATSSDKRDILYPRDKSSTYIDIDKPSALDIFDIDMSNVLSFIQSQKTYNAAPQAPNKCPLTNFGDFILTDGAGTGRRRRLATEAFVDLEGGQREIITDNIPSVLGAMSSFFKFCSCLPPGFWTVETIYQFAAVYNSAVLTCSAFINGFNLEKSKGNTVNYNYNTFTDNAPKLTCNRNNDCKDYAENGASAIRFSLLI